MRLEIALLPLALSGCFTADRVDVFTEEEFEVIKTFSPVPEPAPDPTNKYADDPRAAAFGQRLFFEKGFAKALTIAGSGLGAVGDAGKVSCASCHDPKSYWSDTRSRPNKTSLGVSWTSRNSPSLVNATYYTWGAWGGKDDVLWNQAANGPESGANFAGNRLQFAHLVYQKYRADYDALFPIPLDPALDPAAPDAARFPANGKPKSSGAADGPWEMMTAEDRDIINTISANTGKAIAAYERLLVSRNAPIDRYVAGDYNALTPGAKRGLALFIGKAACNDCHSGPTFSDQSFHNPGVPQTASETAAKVDSGRYEDLSRTLTNTFNGAGKYSDNKEVGMAKLAGIELTDDLKGLFRTQGLRHLPFTGPYMHNGSLLTIEDVVRFYNWGGGASDFTGTKGHAMVPLHLTQQEENDLVEFLKTALTGDPPPEELGMDTAIP
jgi:cytochrome c peroxidase